MSIKTMAMVWELDLPSNEKFVLLAYADHADHDGKNIYPAIATVAWKTGYSERSVQRTTRLLEEKGLLVPDGQGPKGTNKWRFENRGDKLSGVTKGVTPTSPEPIEDEGIPPKEKPLTPAVDKEAGKVISLWENLHTFLIPTHANLLLCMLDEWREHVRKLPTAHPDKTRDVVGVFEEAMKVTGKNARNPHSLSYMDKILKNWIANGYGFNPNERSRQTGFSSGVKAHAL